MPRDSVDRIVEQWARERPDVDTGGMAIIGRISQLARVLQSRLDPVFREHGLESWEFDILATLLRSGPPYELSAGELGASMMITSGSVTHRIDQVQARGFIERRRRADDGRVVLVALTVTGSKVVGDALVAHAQNEMRIVSALSARDRQSLVAVLRRLRLSLDEPAD